MVSVPVNLYSSSESSASVSFNMLHTTCGSRLKQQYICSKEGTVVEKDEIGKGYEFSKGQYVQFSADELMRSMRKMVERAVREQKLSIDESRVLLKFYENGLEGYTYLE